MTTIKNMPCGDYLQAGRFSQKACGGEDFPISNVGNLSTVDYICA
jgi:hypothetical protein